MYIAPVQRIGGKKFRQRLRLAGRSLRNVAAAEAVGAQNTGLKLGLGNGALQFNQCRAFTGTGQTTESSEPVTAA